MAKMRDISELVKLCGNTKSDRSEIVNIRREALLTRTNIRPRGTFEIPAEPLVDEEAEGILLKALSEGDQEVRASVASTLGDIGGENSIRTLVEALKDDEASVALAAAASLGQIGGVDAAEALAIVSGSAPDPNRRFAALTALEQLVAKRFTSGPDRRFSPEARDEEAVAMGLAGTRHEDGFGDGAVTADLEALRIDANADRFLRQKADEILSFLTGDVR